MTDPDNWRIKRKDRDLMILWGLVWLASWIAIMVINWRLALLLGTLFLSRSEMDDVLKHVSSYNINKSNSIK
jgi:hypothetical protein